MAGRSWSEAVEDAVRRYVARTDSAVFDRQALIESELPAIIADTSSIGATPEQTLSRELQHSRNVDVLQFLGAGSYRLRDVRPSYDSAGFSKGVLVIDAQSIANGQLESSYCFDASGLATVLRLVGQWVLYQRGGQVGSGAYCAAAKVERIIAHPTLERTHLALIERGSLLEFGRDVPFKVDDLPVERGLLYPNGRMDNARAAKAVRAISDDDFNRIVDLGLVNSGELLPRQDEPASTMLREEQLPWDGPVDRASVLVNRAVRDRQFRKRVLDAYDSRCALTGMKLINGGGRAETQAAHIMSVEAGGPDCVMNGIALSGTVHWMFDRGLLSLSNERDILVSRKINDLESVERLIFADRKARFPLAVSARPRARYLDWHRTSCFHA